MKQEDRKAAVAAYKERKIEAGIYVVRCTASGQLWVGSAPDIATIQNRLWFTLQLGGNSHRSLQEAWTAHGREAFLFEVIERRSDDESVYARNAALKSLHAQWAEELNAIRI